MMNASLPDILFRAARKCRRIFFDVNSAYWFEKKLGDFSFTRQPGVPVQVSHSSDETISWIESSGEPWMRNRREFAVARDENHIYASLKHDHRIIGYIKVGMNRVYIDDFKQVATFPPRCAFLYDIYVAPDYRKMNLATYLAGHTMSVLKDRGYTHVRLHIPAWNSASLSVARKLGFEQFAHIRAFRILSLITLKVHTRK
ncbi:MAG TPA: GNAT family N-acetyltransferase [Candidatus Omnitrophota bacterium]|nr:GNAT family N-acetyltransferase [Candidatus Omnitrophota bacterium]